ncbi:MAG: HEPN domain-containing protein [Armatimonadota bacterium]
MTPEEAEYIRYRLAKARQTLDEAKYLLDGEFTTGVANRLYYACFYAVSSLLLSDGRASSKHSGVMSMFDRFWVKCGRVPAEMGEFYHLMFKQRQKGDYEDLFSFDVVDLREWLAEAEMFVSHIVGQLQDSIGLCERLGSSDQ